MISKVKKFYSKPFLKETRAPLEIVLYRLLLGLSWTIYQLKYRLVLKRTRAYIYETARNIARDKKSAFVFANGPSMSDIDLRKIRTLCETGKFDLIAINSYLSNGAEIAPPTFAVFADNVHFKEGNTKYTRDIETCEKLAIPYFAPAKYTHNADNLRRGYCSLSNVDAANTSDITKPAGYYGVTAFFALSLAKMLGYTRIYICGFDNSYFRDFQVDENGEMAIHHRHYYDDHETDTLVPCLYQSSSEFFFDTYRHFSFLEKISSGGRIVNVAKKTYLSEIPRELSLDIYKNKGRMAEL